MSALYLLIFELKNLGQKYTHLVLPHFAFYSDRYDHGPRRPMHLCEFESVLHFRKVLPKLQNFANIKLFQFRILRTKKYLAWNLVEFSSVRQLISRWSRLKNLFLQIDYFLYGRVIFTWKTSSFCSTNDVKIDFK